MFVLDNFRVRVACSVVAGYNCGLIFSKIKETPKFPNPVAT